MANETPRFEVVTDETMGQYHETAKRVALTDRADAPTFPGMEPASKEYVDLKLDAVMTRIDGKFDLLNQRMGDLEKRTPSIGAIIATAFTSAVGIVGVLLAAMAFGGDRFDSGIGLADQRQDQIERDADQDAIIRRLDALIAEQPTQPGPSVETPTE